MLHTLSRYVATDAHIASGLTDLVSFINVNNTMLASLNVLATFEVQLEKIMEIDTLETTKANTDFQVNLGTAYLEQNAFDILPNITSLGQARSIGNDKRHVYQSS